MAGMTELKILGAAIVLGLIQLFLQSGSMTAQAGAKWNAGPRDEPRPVTGHAARLERAFHNYLETFPFFAAAILAAFAADQMDRFTLIGSWLYLIGRIVYVPLYWAGIPYVRSLAWLVSLAGIVLILLALFF